MEMLCEGKEVGRLPEPPQPHDHDENNQEPFVFLSFTGRDKARDELARPTYFLLKEILKIKAFLDDGEMVLGSTTDEGLAKPAYQCTHALVMLSPSFPERPYCVKELNTFLHRYQQARAARVQQGSFQLLPALWKLDSLRGYPEDLQRITWAEHDTDNAIYYMLQTLWPRLIEALGLPQMSECELQKHFFTYLRQEFGSPRQVPADFCKYAKDQGCDLSLPSTETHDSSTECSSVPDPSTSTSSTTSSTTSSSSLSPPASPSNKEDSPNVDNIVGISFFHVDMDDNLSWNEKVLQRKESIEEKLAIIAQHGHVIYGRTTMGLKRKTFLGAAVVRLECLLELRGDLSQHDFNVAKQAAVAIGKLLDGAGTTEEDLNKIMIGTFWKGCLALLIEAPEPLLERLYNISKELQSLNGCIDDKKAFKVTGMTPAFTIHAQDTGGIASTALANPSMDKHSDVVLWKDEAVVAGLNLLLPTSLAAREKLLASGVPYMEWGSDNLEGWKSMATTLSPYLPRGQHKTTATTLSLRPPHRNEFANSKTPASPMPASDIAHSETPASPMPAFDPEVPEIDIPEVPEIDIPDLPEIGPPELPATFDFFPQMPIFDFAPRMPAHASISHAGEDRESSRLLHRNEFANSETPGRFDVFISHAGEQKSSVALPLHEHLAAGSLTSFIDHENIPTGLNGPDIMEQAMHEAHVGVFILSPEFIAKKWPMKELLCFLDRYDDAKANGRTIPLLIPVFHSLSWHDCGLSADDLFDKFMNSFSDPQFKFMERVERGETSKESVADALKKLRRFIGVENRHGDAQIVSDTVEEVQKCLEEV